MKCKIKRTYKRYENFLLGLLLQQNGQRESKWDKVSPISFFYRGEKWAVTISLINCGK